MNVEQYKGNITEMKMEKEKLEDNIFSDKIDEEISEQKNYEIIYDG